MSVQVKSITSTPYNMKPLPQKERGSSQDSSVYQAANQAWSYAGKSLIVTRNILNAGLRSCLWISLGGKDAVGNVQSTITRTKLFSAISVPFNAVSISSQAANIQQSLVRYDYEGIYLGLLTFAILMGDTIDSLATSVNAALEIFASTSNPLIASIGLPLGFVLVTLGSASRGIRLAHLNQFRSALENESFMKSGSRMTPQEIHSSVSRFLKELELDEPQKRIALERHTTSGAVNLLNELSIVLSEKGSFDEKESAKVLKTLHRIDSHLRKEMTVQTAYGATNILSFTALCLTVASALSALPFVLLGTAWSARLALQAYQDFQQERL